MPDRQWNARAAVAVRPLVPLTVTAWRLHARDRAAADDSGSLNYTARYHRAVADYPAPRRHWRALYLALAPEVALAEGLRYARAGLSLHPLRLSELRLELAAVLDCGDPTIVGLTLTELCRPIAGSPPASLKALEKTYRFSQRLAWAARARGAEALVAPSATGLGENLILFRDRLRPGSRLVMIGDRDLDLDRYVRNPADGG